MVFTIAILIMLQKILFKNLFVRHGGFLKGDLIRAHCPHTSPAVEMTVADGTRSLRKPRNNLHAESRIQGERNAINQLQSVCA